MDKTPSTVAFDIGLVAESADRQQHVDYSGSHEDGYTPELLKTLTNRIQEIVAGGSLRLTVGAIGFTTGQALLDWLKNARLPFDAAKVSQPNTQP
jgi:hypothetical protein